jgi:hypothetical protein
MLNTGAHIFRVLQMPSLYTVLYMFASSCYLQIQYKSYLMILLILCCVLLRLLRCCEQLRRCYVYAHLRCLLHTIIHNYYTQAVAARISQWQCVSMQRMCVHKHTGNNDLQLHNLSERHLARLVNVSYCCVCSCGGEASDMYLS